MNLLMGKICGSSTGEDKLEQNHDHDHDQPPPPTVLDPLFSSSFSAPPYQHQQQQQPFLSPPPYHHHQGGRRWPFDCEPSLINLQDEEELAGGGRGGCMTMQVEREHMFDKVVTPSDVGKLNRLVIPKQQAERYFPLDTSNNDSNKGGLLLNFEDRNGKLWRFRYSYWNSSQSYVMTKGWSRFVKEKKLDAGDIVSFQRGVGVTAKDRLFIDWRRRVINHPSTPPPHHMLLSSSNLSYNFQPTMTTSFYNHNNNNNNLIQYPWKPLVLQSLIPARSSNSNPNLMLHPATNSNRSSRSVYLGGGLHQQEADVQRSEFRLGFDPSPSASPGKLVSSGKRRLRLFGVNMDCVVFSEDNELDDDQHPSTDQFRNNTGSCNTLIPSSSSSSSFSTIPYLQLRPNYAGGGTDQCNQISSSSSSGLHDFNITTEKPTASNMSLDLKM